MVYGVWPNCLYIKILTLCICIYWVLDDSLMQSNHTGSGYDILEEDRVITSWVTVYVTWIGLLVATPFIYHSYTTCRSYYRLKYKSWWRARMERRKHHLGLDLLKNEYPLNPIHIYDEL